MSAKRWLPAGAILLFATMFSVSAARAVEQSMSGMSGYWNVPAAEVLGDGEGEIGYNIIPSSIAWDSRGKYRNDVYFGAVGVLPRIEALFRVTAIPGLKKFADSDSLSQYTDADRMVGAKVQVLRSRGSVPDLAVGIEDPLGTRRFHTAYVVAGRTWSLGRVRLRADAGYAGGVLKPRVRTTLDGAFFGIEARPVPAAGLAVEYDTEKWNLGLKVRGPLGFRARLGWLGLRAFGGGFGFHLQL